MNRTCPYCGQQARLVTGNIIYPHRPDLSDKNFWHCAPCDAYVGCHHGTTVPLGRLADAKLRKAKMDAHAVFDTLWRHAPKNQRSTARKRAYAWLARELGLPPEDTHIGMMDVDTCMRVIELSRKRVAQMTAKEFGIEVKR